MSEHHASHYKKALLFAQYKTPQAMTAGIDPFQYSSSSDRIVQPPAQPSKLVLALLAVAALHAGIWYVSHLLPTEPLVEKKPEPVVIEIIKPIPKEEPPKIIEPEIPPITKAPEIPPVVEKPKPVEKQIEKPQPIKKVEQPKPITPPQPAPVVAPVSTPIVSENVIPVPIAPPAPPVPVAPPAPPAPPVEQNLPVTEAKGYAGYLSNPAPEYPEIALERGWEGAVLLRVKVSTTGSPLSVEVKNGSGKKVLDDAAIRTVKRWKFSPAMRGNTPIEGWVDVPINYQLPA